MTDSAPVTVHRGVNGTWFVTAPAAIAPGEQIPVANSAELEQITDDSAWLQGLLNTTGLTREQLAQHHRLTPRTPTATSTQDTP